MIYSTYMFLPDLDILAETSTSLWGCENSCKTKIRNRKKERQTLLLIELYSNLVSIVFYPFFKLFFLNFFCILLFYLFEL